MVTPVHKSKAQQRLLKAIKHNPNASVRELQMATKMSSPSIVDYHLTKLIAQELVKRGARWEILEGEAGQHG
jgi:DNA-binding MarR family transcriptional regulator